MVEVIVELLLGVASVAVGFALGSIVFALVRCGRWALLRTERAAPVVDPSGGRWTVRIPLAPTPLRFPASTWMLRMRHGDRRRREAEGASPDGVTSSEIAHPKRLVDTTDEASGFVAVGLLVFAVFALVVFVLEAVVVVLLAFVVALVRLVWGRWQCEVVSPDGRRERVTAGSLRHARDRATQLRESIAHRGHLEDPVTGGRLVSGLASGQTHDRTHTVERERGGS